MSATLFESKGKREPFSMPPQKDTYKGGIEEDKYKTKRLYEPDFLTTDEYQDSLVFDMRMFSKILIHMKIANNPIKYNLLACLDPSMWKVLKADQMVNTGAEKTEVLADAWNWVKLQVVSYGAGNAGKVNAFITGKPS